MPSDPTAAAATELDAAEVLSASCSALNPNLDTLLKLDNETCADGPEQCRPNTICCDGECRGLPFFPERRKKPQHCPLDSM